MKNIHSIALALTASLLTATAGADAPAYTIIDLGVVSNAPLVQGFGISPDGSVATGRTLGSQHIAYSWTAATGMVALPNIGTRKYAVANGANDFGIVVGTSMTNSYVGGQLPVMWNQGVLTEFAVPDGYGVGQATAVNASGQVVGSVGSGIGQRAALFGPSGTTLITATTASGSYMTVAYGINDAAWRSARAWTRATRPSMWAWSTTRSAAP